jgi:hypothetical protein
MTNGIRSSATSQKHENQPWIASRRQPVNAHPDRHTRGSHLKKKNTPKTHLLLVAFDEHRDYICGNHYDGTIDSDNSI